MVRQRLLVLQCVEFVDVITLLTLAVEEDADADDATQDESSESGDDQVVDLELLPSARVRPGLP